MRRSKVRIRGVGSGCGEQYINFSSSAAGALQGDVRDSAFVLR